MKSTIKKFATAGFAALKLTSASAQVLDPESPDFRMYAHAISAKHASMRNLCEIGMLEMQASRTAIYDKYVGQLEDEDKDQYGLRVPQKYLSDDDKHVIDLVFQKISDCIKRSKTPFRVTPHSTTDTPDQIIDRGNQAFASAATIINMVGRGNVDAGLQSFNYTNACQQAWIAGTQLILSPVSPSVKQEYADQYTKVCVLINKGLQNIPHLKNG